jgi:hypothetical protein
MLSSHMSNGCSIDKRFLFREPSQGEVPRIHLPRLSEKGASDALSVDLAGIRRSKWAEKHCFGCP